MGLDQLFRKMCTQRPQLESGEDTPETSSRLPCDERDAGLGLVVDPVELNYRPIPAVRS